MKNVFILITVILSSFTILLSVPKENIGANLYSKNYLYEIKMPAKTINGRYIPEKIMEIKKLDDEFIEQNIIEIKTVDYEYFNTAENQFINPNLKDLFSFLNIISIKNPYSEYFQGNQLLSVDKIGITRIYQIRYSNEINPFDVCKQIIDNSDIEYATPIYKRNSYGFIPNDAWYQLGYHLAKINMPEAWEITKGDTNVYIAIIDSGTDIKHEDLAANIWTNPKEIPNNGIDDDGNGKIDDVHGWDLIGNISAQQLISGQYKEDNDPTNMIATHGTHTAGCASAVTNNTIGVAAPGFNCKIMPVKCASDGFNSAGISRGYEGILYAAVTGAKIISCSWGGPGWSPVEEDIMNQVISMDAVVVVASGNSGKNIDEDPDYPAAFRGVLCVGSTGQSDKYSQFTSYGNAVRVYAPGENIWSTLPGNKYEAQSGTSMATPIVAGVVALLKSIHKDWTAEQIIHQLRATSDNVLVTSNPSLRPYFFGRINAAKALEYNYKAGKNIAGIELVDVRVDNGNNFIANYNNNNIKISLKNYLANDNNIKVRILPIDNFIEFEQNTFDIGSFQNFETKDIIVKAKLLDNNPWYKGSAKIMFEITGTDYINYEMAQINIRVPSENRLYPLSTISSAYGIVWHNSCFLNNDIIYYVGASPSQQVGGVVLKANTKSSSLLQVNTAGTYSVYAFDENNLLVGDGPSNGMASIYYTSNAGKNWTKKPINTITGFINSFIFFNKFQGILLGDPIGSNWGVASTNDAGQTWKLLTNLSPPLANETGLVGSVLQKKDTIWFGTTQGRLFRTNDKGETWSVSTVLNGGVVSSVAFNENLAACLYSASNAQGADRLLAISKDGGKTWTSGVYNFTQNNQIPLTVYAVEDSKTIIVQLYSGHLIASDNGGLGWYPILSEEKGKYIYAVANQFGNEVNMYAAGTDMTRLTFNYKPSVEKKTLSIVGGNIAVFDSVEIGKIKDITINIKNVGNTPASINNITIKPDSGTEQNEFRVLMPAPNIVSPASPTELRIRFAPKSSGIRTARVTIKSDADNPEINLDLIGYGIPTTRVDINNMNDNIKIIPNPSSESIMISCKENLQFKKVKIIDINGNELMSMNNVETNNIINISQLPIGVYNIILENENLNYKTKFTIIR